MDIKSTMPMMSLSEENIKKMEEIISSSIQQSMTPNFKKSIEEASRKMASVAVRSMVAQLERFRPVITISFDGLDEQHREIPSEDATATDAVETPVQEENPETIINNEKKSAQQHLPLIDIDAVCNAIREGITMIQNGEDLKVTSDLVAEEVRRLSENRITVYLARFGRYHMLMPNFRYTKEVVALYKNNWPGWVGVDKVKEVLVSAFCRASVNEPSEESTSILSGTRASGERTSGYKQGSYFRVKPGSMMMRMRCHKNSNELAPMVIDSKLARQMYNDGYTYVSIGSEDNRKIAEMTNKVVDLMQSRSINLIFKKEANRTRAPYKSPTISRLHPYGKGGKNRSRNSTFCINGDAFQRTILKWFNETCIGQKECFFKLVPTGKENPSGISYRIEQA